MSVPYRKDIAKDRAINNLSKKRTLEEVDENQEFLEEPTSSKNI